MYRLFYANCHRFGYIIIILWILNIKICQTSYRHLVHSKYFDDDPLRVICYFLIFLNYFSVFYIENLCYKFLKMADIGKISICQPSWNMVDIEKTLIKRQEHTNMQKKEKKITMCPDKAAVLKLNLLEIKKTFNSLHR